MHGISTYVGSVEVGKLADLVLWKPENFSVKPEMVLKSGVIVWAQVRLSFPLNPPAPFERASFSCLSRWCRVLRAGVNVDLTEGMTCTDHILFLHRHVLPCAFNCSLPPVSDA